MTKVRFLLGAAAVLAMADASAAYGQNLLTNPGFEAPPVRANGDVYFASNSGNLTGWRIEGSGAANVPQVDGIGSFVYGAGPEADASGVTTGPRRYLDLGAGNKSVYQSFTAPCTATYRFGASFSDRQKQGGWGQTILVTGASPAGPVLASSPMITIPAGQPSQWGLSAASVTLTAGQAYTFKIAMDEKYMNADEAFVTRTGECKAQTVDVTGDHFQCYRIARGAALTPESITVADQFTKAKIVLGRPVMLCNPSIKIHNGRKYGVLDAKRHMVCYAIVRASDKVVTRRVRVANQFTTTDLIVTDRTMFCVPSYKTRLDGKELPLE